MANSKKIINEQPRKLTAHDLAFGIGRKFTDEEISMLIKEYENDKFTDGDVVVNRIIEKLNKKKIATDKV